MSGHQPSVEYDYDGDHFDVGLPPLCDARTRLTESIREWGDGEVMEGFHTRDMAALLAALDEVEALADEWEADHGILSPDSRYTRDVLVRELRAAIATRPGDGDSS